MFTVDFWKNNNADRSCPAIVFQPRKGKQFWVQKVQQILQGSVLKPYNLEINHYCEPTITIEIWL